MRTAVHNLAVEPPAVDGGFFQLCGSPICAPKATQGEVDHCSDNEEHLNQATRQTVRDRRASINAFSATKHWGDEDIHDDRDREALEREEEQTAQLTLVGARQARIPCFMSEWYENKTDSPRQMLSPPPPPPLPPPLPPTNLDHRYQHHRHHQSIRMTEIALGKEIGRGAFGKVYTAMWQRRRVAVKVLVRTHLSEDVMREFETEVHIMSGLHHANICRLLGAVLEPMQRALVVELVERGSLWQVLHHRHRGGGARRHGREYDEHRRRLSLDVRTRFVLDAARGMKYLHEFDPPILHRDLKSPNLLVEKDYTVKISDFGLARVKAQVATMTGNCGTVQWMAPEVLGNCKYTEKADVYSFGVVMWEIFTSRCPYDGMAQIQAALGVLNHDLRPAIPRHCPAFFARLMRLCWAREPERRPTFAQIVSSCERRLAQRIHT